MSVVELNVSGTRIEVLRSTLEKSDFFRAMLDRPELQIRGDDGSIFVDEDPDDFRALLKILRGRESAVKGSLFNHLIDYYQVSSCISLSPPPEPLKLEINRQTFIQSYVQQDTWFAFTLPANTERFDIQTTASDLIIDQLCVNEVRYTNTELSMLFDVIHVAPMRIWRSNKYFHEMHGERELRCQVSLKSDTSYKKCTITYLYYK